MKLKGKIDCCPHCGSDWGFYTKSTYVNIPYNWDFDGEPQDNGEMFDNAEQYKNGQNCYCQNCGKVICRKSTMIKLIGRDFT